MKRTLIATALMAATATASAQDMVNEDWARVTRVTPEMQRVSTPREECRTEYIAGSAQAPSERSYAGAIIGGVTGGLLGAQVGKGNGSKAAAAVGAIAGTLIGDSVANGTARAQPASPQPVRRCATVDQWEERVSGYRVNYQYAGRSFETVLPYDPGQRLKVRVSVEPVLEQPRAPNAWESRPSQEWGS